MKGLEKLVSTKSFLHGCDDTGCSTRHALPLTHVPPQPSLQQRRFVIACAERHPCIQFLALQNPPSRPLLHKKDVGLVVHQHRLQLQPDGILCLATPADCLEFDGIGAALLSPLVCNARDATLCRRFCGISSLQAFPDGNQMWDALRLEQRSPSAAHPGGHQNT